MRTWFSILLLILGLAGLWGAARIHQSLLAWRVAHGQAEAVVLERSPPLVVFTTVALGGFRGIIADLLWMRAIRLQEEGSKVFELVQLSDWIGKLEPHLATVWVFNAWNLAYNISILFPDPEDRWRWVNAGLRLLRDEGLAYNPKNATLHRELGWIYQHKIGYYLDPAHLVYKKKLLQEMTAFFDGPRPDYAAARQDPRLQRLKTEAKLDPALMEQLDREHGPLDWRLPATHAIYWVSRGLQLAGLEHSAPRDHPPGCSCGAHSAYAAALATQEALQCEHMLCQCLAESFRHGRLVTDRSGELYLATPDLELLPQVLRAYEAILRRYPKEAKVQWAYAGYFREATVILFAYGRMAEAYQVYRRLTEQFPPGALPDFETFLLDSLRIGVEATPLQDAVALVEGFLVRYYSAAARGDAAGAAAWENLACLIWERLQADCPTMERWERAGLAPLDVMRRQAYRRAISEAPDAELAARLLALPPDPSLDFWPDD